VTCLPQSGAIVRIGRPSKISGTMIGGDSLDHLCLLSYARLRAVELQTQRGRDR
jgi:hypothetical protein